MHAKLDWIHATIVRSKNKVIKAGNEFVILDLLKWWVFKRCNKKVYFRLKLVKERYFAQRYWKRSRKTSYKAAGVNLPVWVSKTLAQKSELDVTSKLAIRTWTVRKKQKNEPRSTHRHKFFWLNFTVATCRCAIPYQPYTVGVQFQFV